MKKFIALAIAILFFMLIAIPCFADDSPPPFDPTKCVPQPITLDVIQ